MEIKEKVQEKTVNAGRKEAKSAEELQRQALTTGIAELDKVFDENQELNRQNDSLKFYLKQASSRLHKSKQKQPEVYS
jgi:hypothetical protein